MKLDLNTRIDAPADLVWTVLADEFVQVAAWLPTVVNAYELQAEPIAGAPFAGRVCEFTEDGDAGLQAHETITLWDKASGRLELDVVVKNAPAVIPVSKNVARFQVTDVDGGAVVTLAVEPTLKPHGYLVYPLLKRNFSQQFGGLLSKLKAHVEQRHAAAA